MQCCRFHNIPLCDQLDAVLKRSAMPRSLCYQIENTGSRLEENVGISQIMELSIANRAIIICTFLIFAHTFGHGTRG